MLPHGINTATDLHHQGLQPTYGFHVTRPRTVLSFISPGIDASMRYLTGTHKRITRSKSISPRSTAIMIPIIFKMIKRICNTILSSLLFF